MSISAPFLVLGLKDTTLEQFWGVVIGVTATESLFWDILY